MDFHLLIGAALACVLWRLLRTTPPLTKGEVHRMFGKLLALVGLKMPPYPAEVIRVMRGLRKDEDAQINVELVRRVPFWADEGFDEITMICMRAGSDRWDDPFQHRLFLLTGLKQGNVDYKRCEESWIYLKRHCPTWPGFESTRCDPVRGPEIMTLLAETYEAL